MLEGLDAIDWANLTHAYGPADDVPDQIRALASGDAVVRYHALQQLYGNIFHQGTLYQATPQAVPFLYELLLAPGLEGKAEIITFLAYIAIGYDDDYLPQGIDPESYLEKLTGYDASLSEEDRAACEEFGFGPAVNADCYRAVADGALLSIDFLKSPDAETRNSAAYALAWFPGIASKSFGPIMSALESEPALLNAVTMILSLGLLARNSRQSPDELKGYLDPRYPLPQRTATAIALARAPLQEDVLAALTEALARPDDVQPAVKGLKFNSGWLTTYAALTLAHFGKSSAGCDDPEAPEAR